MYNIIASHKVSYQTAVLERLEFQYGKAVRHMKCLSVLEVF